MSRNLNLWDGSEEKRWCELESYDHHSCTMELRREMETRELVSLEDEKREYQLRGESFPARKEDRLVLLRERKMLDTIDIEDFDDEEESLDDQEPQQNNKEQ